MSFERWILIGFSFLCILAIFKLVPREKARDACVLFLFLQIITWPAGLFAVEMGWIEYPTQLLPNANQYNRTSFTFEFFIFPIVAIFFSLYYPNKAKIKGALIYYISFAGFFTVCEVVLEKYTTLVEYHEWKWYWSLSTIIISLFLNHRYYLWFKKRLVKVEGG
ncbi:hypothetical protein G6549_11490 [Bacillus sp. MM2020_1]|nr:hypothetical protein [Bacillus sp. MM2020_1]